MAETTEERLASLEERVSLLEDSVTLIQGQIINLTPKMMTNALDLVRGNQMQNLQDQITALKSQLDTLSATVRGAI